MKESIPKISRLNHVLCRNIDSTILNHDRETDSV